MADLKRQPDTVPDHPGWWDHWKDFDSAALMAALDATEEAGVPPHLVGRLRKMVRREAALALDAEECRLKSLVKAGTISDVKATIALRIARTRIIGPTEREGESRWRT